MSTAGWNQIDGVPRSGPATYPDLTVALLPAHIHCIAAGLT
jgi:hypothetical protein